MKLLGDGAMLRFTGATVGVEAALDLVDTMSDEVLSHRMPVSTPAR